MPRLPDTEKKRSASYPAGATPQARRFAMSMQLALLEAALAPWPRRQTPLLEVNCGNGAFLQFLWQCGFDVHGSEADAGLRLRAQKRAVPGAEIHAALDDDLPFENDAFDWVIVHLKTGEADGIASCAGEAARLARRGLMITFWNSGSIPALCWRLTHAKPWAPNTASWWLVWRLLNGLGLGRVTSHSTLAAPVCAWRRQWNMTVPGLPLGGWCAIRLDMGPAAPVTPLRLNLRLRQPEPLIEFAPKRTATGKQDEAIFKLGRKDKSA
ncbi:MAG: methyltransferase domain-containing protein [Desulfovibrio sp.]|nr:methyltransferase domain-containing protein [Desulfovibrio sp.]